MEENLHDIDDLFRKGLDRGEAQPSGQVWEHISHVLDEQTRPAAMPARTGSIIFRAAASVLLISIAAYFWMRTDTTQRSGIFGRIPGTSGIPFQDSPVLSRPLLSTSPASSPRAVEPTKGIARKGRTEPAGTVTPSLLPLTVLTETGTEQDARNRSASGFGSLPVVRKCASQNKQDGQHRNVPRSTGEESRMAATYASAGLFTGTLESRTIEPTLDLVGRTTAAGMQATALVPSNLPEKAAIPAFLPPLASPALVQHASPAKPAGTRLQLPKFSLTPIAALSVTSNKFREHPPGPASGTRHRTAFRETEENQLTLSPGILAEFRLGRRLALTTGLSGFRNSLHIAPKQIETVRDSRGEIFYRVDCSLGSFYLAPKAGTSPPVPGDSIRLRASSAALRYASVPLTLKWYGGNSRISYFALAGGEYNVLLQKHFSATLQTAPTEQHSPSRTEGVKTHFARGVVGGGVDVRLSRQLSFTLMPQYRFALSATSQGIPGDTYANSFTITSGLRISL